MIISQKEGALGTLIINRPERLNTLNPELVFALKKSIDEMSRDKAVRVLIITGQGDRAFIGGVDLQVFEKFGPAEAEEFITNLHKCILSIRQSEKIVIASINGYALGGGLELAACCDLRIASDTAQFGMPEVKVGVPSVIEAAYLPRLIGIGRTAELVLTGDMIDAREAERMGLVNKIVPPDKIKEETRKMADRILENGPRALVLQKRLMTKWMEMNLDDSVQAGIKFFREAFHTPEPREGSTAFLEKRKPNFQR